MKTEIIASWKLVLAKGREMYIITTTLGNTIWCTKNQFDSNAETITYQPLVKGTEYTNSKGEKAQLQADRNEYIGSGKQIVKKYDAKEILDHLASKGITPTFSMS